MSEVQIENYFMPLNYGLLDDSPYDEYFSLPAINCSAIKYGLRSPYHMDMYLAGQFKETKDSYNFGNYFHLYILEEEKFFEHCFVVPETPPDREKWDKRKKAHREFWEQCIFEAEGRELVEHADFIEMQKMKDSLMKQKGVFNIVKMGGITEKIMLWKNKDIGINCKGRTDKFIPGNFICDLKSTKDASERGFLKDFERYDYKVQAAIYTDALIELGYGELPFIFIAIEHSPPYFSKVYEVSQEKINEGRKMYVSVLQKYVDYKNNKIDLTDVYVI